jgi:hypothetical protein
VCWSLSRCRYFLTNDFARHSIVLVVWAAGSASVQSSHRGGIKLDSGENFAKVCELVGGYSNLFVIQPEQSLLSLAYLIQARSGDESAEERVSLRIFRVSTTHD